MTPNSIHISFAGHSRIKDIRALLDSYAVELKYKGAIYLSHPLDQCSTAAPPSTLDDPAMLDARVDPQVEVSLHRRSPPFNPERKSAERWPFFVNDPLAVYLTAGNQWWLFKFTPGVQYEERKWGPPTPQPCAV